MEDTAQLTFQTHSDPKLAQALARRTMLPTALTITGVLLAVAALLHRTGGSGTWTVALAFTGVWTPVMLLIMAPRQAVARAGDQIGRPIAFKIDAAGVHTTHGFSTTTLDWSQIKAVHPARGQIVLSCGWLPGGKRAMAAIPTTGLTPAEQTRLLEVLHSRGAALTIAPAS
ncbi:hypothetical protein Q0Z83_037500 [Actinoplanes sichuanensis]|uniref:YcxB-like protein domain-containing protein n=1 Tax=Actinoplanes sichuanensis TaxID=512349 RepID=A0ABW4A4G5_9ACTN|nr:hypothetical protein [Actinoplanes sichuanensis]BEL05559.1 hypothetical protein Q0Z83_037500 [Actinoplanes sichuanensis]